ncbi:hypothetical protein C8J55DRAFT_510371 [Lentinula edodes]|uniref:F-box domain-containing protein n=1 Tax=Lentinula lateritia TaxID=40482 RepID=A0A9W9AJQ4_9AGAR|nr:hypothetical protein C8J55DRAFT_510371 [Lentinula edodes]
MDDELLRYNQRKYDDFLAKIRINDVPLSSKEFSELETDILATRDDLLRCEKDNIRAVLRMILECQESLLSPIRKLPSEILGAIFSLIAGAITEPPLHLDVDVSYFGISLSFRNKKFVGRVFPLTWVCSWWRSQALTQPELWSSIYLGNSHGNNDATRREEGLTTVERLKYILRRSGTSCPMDFRLDIPTVTNLHDTLPFVAISSTIPLDHIQYSVMEVLTDWKNRWRSFTFHTDSPENFETFYGILATKLVSTQFPFLVNLDLGSGFDLSNELPAVRSVEIKFSSSCPRLRSLVIPSLASTDLIDLKNLTILELHNYSGSSFAYLLYHCPRLESLAVGFFYSGRDLSSNSFSPISPLRHTHLMNLKIKGMGENFASGAWDLIHLPNLTQVTVSFWLRMSDNALDELGEMLIRSNCPLRKVQLLWNSFNIFEYSYLEKFLYEIPFSPECEYYINEGRYPRTH